jgi:hypothetical protein
VTDGIDVGALTNDEAAAYHESLTEEIRRHEQAATHLKATREAVRNVLFQRLGPGEVAVSHHNGRVCVKKLAPETSATVNREAVDDYAAILPEELQPRREMKYPTVTAIRQAIKDRRLPRDRGRDLLIEGERVYALRWQKVGDPVEV